MAQGALLRLHPATIAAVASVRCRPCEPSLRQVPALGSGPGHPLLPCGVQMGVKPLLEDVSFPQTQSHPVLLCLGASFPQGSQCRGTGQSFSLYCTQEHPFANAATLCTSLFYNDPTTKHEAPQSMPHSQPSPFPPLPGCTEPPFQTLPCGVALLVPGTLLQSPRECDALWQDKAGSAGDLCKPCCPPPRSAGCCTPERADGHKGGSMQRRVLYFPA